MNAVKITDLFRAAELPGSDNYIARCAADCLDETDRSVFAKVVKTGEQVAMGRILGEPIEVAKGSTECVLAKSIDPGDLLVIAEGRFQVLEAEHTGVLIAMKLKGYGPYQCGKDARVVIVRGPVSNELFQRWRARAFAKEGKTLPGGVKVWRSTSFPTFAEAFECARGYLDGQTHTVGELTILPVEGDK
jgi:hypothetical protein